MALDGEQGCRGEEMPKCRQPYFKSIFRMWHSEVREEFAIKRIYPAELA